MHGARRQEAGDTSRRRRRPSRVAVGRHRRDVPVVGHVCARASSSRARRSTSKTPRYSVASSIHCHACVLGADKWPHSSVCVCLCVTYDQAKVAAVEGNFIRVHYKVRRPHFCLSFFPPSPHSHVRGGGYSVCVFSRQGQSTDNDEWLPMNSRDLRERIVTVSPPRPIRTKTGPLSSS